MRVLILGGAGMLGHQVYAVLSRRFETWATVRERSGPWRQFPMYEGSNRVVTDVDAEKFDSVIRAFERARPDAVINCVGIVKQLAEAKDPRLSLRINALFPHELAALTRASGARLIHISTDCVFAGTRGMYKESELTDAEDLYGRTKALGEVTGEGCLTLRTSIIGRDFVRSTSLVEWFLSQRGRRIRGFRDHIYTGFPTRTLAELIGDLLEKHPGISGLYQAASPPIDKFTLLTKLRDAFGAQVEIEPVELGRLDRSLDGSRLTAATGFVSPDWDSLCQTLASDLAPYDEWRRRHAVEG